MRRYVPRVLFTAALAVSATACASGGAGVDLGTDLGGRYRVLVPAMPGPSGDAVAEELRGLISGMGTHAAVARGAMEDAMGQYELEQLDEITARQLAQQVNVENVLWGEVEQGGAGLQADVKFIDVRSGDEITIEDVGGANPDALAQAIFAQVQEKVEGIRQAAFCNDYLSSQQFDRALETCEKALAIVPTSTSALYGRATALLNLDRQQDALQVYQQLLEIDPQHQDALLGAGLAASRLGQSNDAQQFYQRYMEVNPGNVQVRMTVANDIAKTGDYLSAFRLLEPAVAENRDNADFMRYLFSIAAAAGQKVQQEQDAAAARPIFETAMQAYDATFAQGGAELDASTLRQAVAVQNALGNTQEALRIARDATTRFDTVAAIWSQYASVLSDAGQHAEAARALTRVSEIDPDYENIYIRRAMAYKEAGNQQAMLADLERAAQRGNRENVAKVLYSAGAEAFQANRFSAAADLMEQASRYADADLRNQINFVWGFSMFRQGEAIAKANTQGRAAEARRALPFFERALQLGGQTNSPQAGTLVNAAKQYIENQQAIIKAAQ